MPPMQSPRSGMAMVSYRGMIVAIGGFDGANVLSSVEVYDMSRECWVEVASLTCPRFTHAAAVVGTTLYVFGGCTGSSILDTVECLDLTRLLRGASWEQVPELSMPEPRLGLSVVAADSLLYVLGGYNQESGHLSSVDCVDLNTLQWISLAPMGTKRS